MRILALDVGTSSVKAAVLDVVTAAAVSGRGCQICDHLAKPPLREKDAKLGDCLKERIRCRLAHGNLSPTDGYDFTGIGRP